jgi:hypothetical protein
MTPPMTALRNRVHRALLVLEADGATPTQQHVSDFRAAWDALKAAIGTDVPIPRNTVHSRNTVH